MRLLTRLLFVAATLAGAAGCKQGLGDRCQIDDDCASGYCSTGSNTHVCTATPTTIGIDAPAPQVDAPGADAAVPDAAAPDAGEVDAPVPDAP